MHFKGNLDLNKILMICKNNCSSVYLRDFDLVKNSSQIGVIINFDNPKKINLLIKEIKSINRNIDINLINKHNII